MKTSISLQLFALSILLLTSCKTAYQSADFDEVSADHVYVAVLPIKVEYVGKHLPENKMEEIESSKLMDSKSFQQAMSTEILTSSRKARKGLTVKLIPTSTVLNKLTEAGIDPLQSLEMDAKKLAEIVGADAVVKGQISKNQYFSDGASAAVDIGTSILGQVGAGVYLPGANAIDNNKRVQGIYELIDAKDGSIIWASDCNVAFDWKSKHNDVVRTVTRRIARSFPYKQ